MQRANQNKSKGQLIIESGCLKEKPNIRNKKNMVWWGKLKASINWNTKTQETESGCLEFLLCWWKLSSHKCRSVERKKIRREIFKKKKTDFQKTSVLWVMLHDAVVAWFFFFLPRVYFCICVCVCSGPSDRLLFHWSVRLSTEIAAGVLAVILQKFSFPWCFALYLWSL